MDVRERLHAQASAVGTPPRRDVAEVVAAGGRRRARRRAVTGAGGLAAVVALAALLLPASPVGIGEIAERPGGEVALGLPDGWQQVEAGDAVFGVPGDHAVVELAADEPYPCPPDDGAAARTFLGLDTFGAAAGREMSCDVDQPTGVVVYASALGDPPHNGADIDWMDHDERRIDTPAGSALLRDFGGPDEPMWSRNYELPAVDLYLTFDGLALDPGIDEQILSTVRPREATADDPEPRVGEVVLHLPEGWQPVEVGDAVLGVPGDREVVHLGADDPYPCTNMDDEPRAYVAPAGLASGGGCDARGPRYAGILALPRSTVYLDSWVAWDGTRPDTVDTDAGPADVYDLDDGWGGRLYVIEDADLVLRFDHLDLDPAFAEAVLDTVRLHPDAPTPPSAPERETVELPTWFHPDGMAMEALTSGILRGDLDDGCVWLEQLEPDDRSPLTLIWPDGHTLDVVTGEVVDRDGEVVATIGDQVQLGGGFIRNAEVERCDVGEEDGAWIASGVS